MKSLETSLAQNSANPNVPVQPDSYMRFETTAVVIEVVAIG